MWPMTHEILCEGAFGVRNVTRLTKHRHLRSTHCLFDQIFHRWGIDMVGPMKETVRRNKYIVVDTEYLTRWPEAQAEPDKSAEGIHRFLTSLVCRYGSSRAPA